MLKPIEILLVEDNPGDTRLVLEELKECTIINKLHVVEDGEQALDYICGFGKYAETARPDMIILDLNLPKRHGHEVLAEMNQDPKLRSIPVVIMTSSRARNDIVDAYNLDASCYAVKPLTITKLMKILNAIDGIGLAIVKEIEDQEEAREDIAIVM